MKRQAELIKQMTDKEIVLNVYISQGMMLLIALILGWIWFDSWSSFFQLFQWDFREIILIGGGVAVIVILVDLLLYKCLPKAMTDDGGINERVFSNRHIVHIFFIAALVACTEEILFRGVLQTNIGLIPASLIFAFIHFRYLNKIVLFTLAIVLSFLLGLLFQWTGNLLVPIFAHFLIDFVLGTMIMLKSKKKEGKIDI